MGGDRWVWWAQERSGWVGGWTYRLSFSSFSFSSPSLWSLLEEKEREKELLL